MRKQSIAAALALGLLSLGGSAQAYIYDEDVCSMGSTSTWPLGTTHNISFSAGALRTASGYIPVEFYLSTTPTLTTSSIYLKTNYQAYIYQPGPYCSEIVQEYLTLPSTTNGSCFAVGNYYVVAKAGTDTMSVLLAVTAGNQPTLTSFSPPSAPVGGIVTLTGTNFTAQTFVTFNGVSAARAILSPTSMIAQVPAGAASGVIRVGHTSTPNLRICNVQQASTTNFEVDPYCQSTADYLAYGAIDYVATSEFVNDTRGGSTCPVYTRNTQLVTSATAGQVGKQIDIAFGSCGGANYEKLFKMYVDWNADNDFTDAGELIIDAPSVSSDVTYTITFNIPASVLPGNKRVRFVTAVYDGTTVVDPSDVSSCGIYNYGETEDYLLNVLPMPAFTSGVRAQDSKPASLTVSGPRSQTVQGVPEASRERPLTVLPAPGFAGE
ncbi:GEVED domain-containing protein [Pyxidicoccus trucidator]|uniref:GEVED domain-containing protein n=1 Tax=Pyxidicoccus trucidator TaxID=2709662 RepID=UPI0013DC8D1A|nr:GEVED domain-containing protein [Pyxidicoccus trucidator]